MSRPLGCGQIADMNETSSVLPGLSKSSQNSPQIDLVIVTIHWLPSSFSRMLNLGLRGKNKLTQGILFGNIQELAAAFQLCWHYSLSLRKDSLDEWAGTCPCLFPNKWPNFQVQAHYSPGAQKFHLQRGFHWITLNSFRKKSKNKPFLQKPTASYTTGTTLGLEQQVCQQNHCLHVQASSLVHTTRGAITKLYLQAETVTSGLLQPGLFQACYAEAWTSGEQGLCGRLSLIIKCKERKGRVEAR